MGEKLIKEALRVLDKLECQAREEGEEEVAERLEEAQRYLATYLIKQS